MLIQSVIAAHCGLNADQIFGLPGGDLVTIRHAGGEWYFPLWNVPGVTPPTSAEIDAAIAAGPSLDDVRAERIALLRATCAATIVGGVIIAALGSAHLYPTDATAQINVGGLVTRSLLAPPDWTCEFACADASGAWAYRVHSGTQIQAVGIAVSDHIAAAMTHFDGLRSDVLTAPDIAAVAAITWEI